MDTTVISSWSLVISSLALLAWPTAMFGIAWLYKKEITTLFKVVLGKNLSVELPGGIKMSVQGADQQKAEASSVPAKLREAPNVRRTPAIEKLEQELLSQITQFKQEDRVRILALNLAAAQLAAAFGQIYALIFGSQILGLSELEKRGHVTNEEANVFFIEYAAKRFPLIYAKYDFSGWMRFLLSNNLIEQDQSNIRITDTGRDFLLWLEKARLPVDKQG
jgi:hypothetical protein